MTRDRTTTMVAACPNCRTRLDLPTSGRYECERCRTRFDVALGSPRPAPPQVPPGAPYGPAAVPGAAPYYPAGVPAPASTEPVPVDPSLHAPCVAHRGNPAASICERCGDFMCRLCTTPVEGRLYCPRCFDLLYNRGSLQFAQRQFTLPGTTFGLGLGSFLTSAMCGFIIGLPMAIGGIFTGLRALREYRERPELPGRGLTYWGLALCGLGILATLGWIGFFAWSFTRGS